MYHPNHSVQYLESQWSTGCVYMYVRSQVKCRDCWWHCARSLFRADYFRGLERFKCISRKWRLWWFVWVVSKQLIESALCLCLLLTFKEVSCHSVVIKVDEMEINKCLNISVASINQDCALQQLRLSHYVTLAWWINDISLSERSG